MGVRNTLPAIVRLAFSMSDIVTVTAAFAFDARHCLV
jgi:hypothetical protein